MSGKVIVTDTGFAKLGIARSCAGACMAGSRGQSHHSLNYLGNLLIAE